MNVLIPWGAFGAIGGLESDDPPEINGPAQRSRGLIILKKRGGSWWLPSGND